MTDRTDPIVLDSSVLVAYERMKTPGAYALHEAQSRVAEWLVQRVTLLVPALSLAVASHECAGQLPELDFLMRGDPDLVLVVPLARESAVEIGAASTAARAEEFETAHVIWCAAGHAADDPGARWPVATFWPEWYAHADVPIVSL